MASIVAARRFAEDLAGVWSERIVQDVTRAVQAIATFPRIGSSEIAASISEEFGEDVMKVVVGPFDLIYEYDEATDTVYLYGLIHGRSAR